MRGESIPCVGCSQVEGRKRYEFLEALVVSMDGHLRHFKRGYEVPKPSGPLYLRDDSLLSHGRC